MEREDTTSGLVFQQDRNDRRNPGCEDQRGHSPLQPVDFEVQAVDPRVDLRKTRVDLREPVVDLPETGIHGGRQISNALIDLLEQAFETGNAGFEWLRAHHDNSITRPARGV